MNIVYEPWWLLQLKRKERKVIAQLSVLFQPCRSCLLLVTLKMSCSVSMNEINNDEWNDDDGIHQLSQLAATAAAASKQKQSFSTTKPKAMSRTCLALKSFQVVPGPTSLAIFLTGQKCLWSEASGKHLHDLLLMVTMHLLLNIRLTPRWIKLAYFIRLQKSGIKLFWGVAASIWPARVHWLLDRLVLTSGACGQVVCH